MDRGRLALEMRARGAQSSFSFFVFSLFRGFVIAFNSIRTAAPTDIMTKYE